MGSLIFDIETSVSQQPLDEVDREYLLSPADKEKDEAAKAEKRQQLEEQFSFWPFTAEIVCIALINSATEGGRVLYVSDDYEEPAPDAAIRFESFPGESELLTAFWGYAESFKSIVTFNGRTFDVPFLYLRSAKLNVPISQKNWLGYRYSNKTHCDLLEQLTFYNVSGYRGAARSFSLDFYCRQFSIPSPKAEGVSGADVGRLVNEGKTREVAEYCLRDVQATGKLYQLWQERLAAPR